MLSKTIALLEEFTGKEHLSMEQVQAAGYKGQELRPWQTHLKPGDHFARVVLVTDDAPCVYFGTILEKTGLAWQEFVKEFTAEPNDPFTYLVQGSEADCTVCNPWHVHAPLSQEQWDRLAAADFPGDTIAEFLAAIAPVERAEVEQAAA